MIRFLGASALNSQRLVGRYILGATLFGIAACGIDTPSNRPSADAATVRKVPVAIDFPIVEMPIASRLVAHEPGVPAPFRDEEIRRWLDFRQIDRIGYEDRFQFPNFRQQASDEYTEARVVPPLDLLVITDNSGSMSPYQANLASKLDPLLSFVQFADWRIHVVTTDTDDAGGSYLRCPSRGIINKADPNFRTKFATAVTAGTSGDSTERGIKAARLALEHPCPDAANWLRPGSALAILIVSDEDNCSNHGGCSSDAGGGAWDESKYLSDYLATIRTIGDNVRMYGLLEDNDGTPNSCKSQPTANATRYWDVIFKTGGICGSVHDNDYSPTLRKISEDVAGLLPPSITLRQMPVNGQVTVTVDGQVLPASAYRLQGTDLFLLQPIRTGQRVVVSYEYDGPYSRDFRLTNPAAPDSVQVETQGHFLNPSDFTYAIVNSTVRIVSNVDPLQQLRVVYKENKPLRTVFFVGPVADPTTIHCFLSTGTEITTLRYDVAQQSIIFTKPPTELQMFKCTMAR